MEEILRIKDLKVSFDSYSGSVKAVRGVSLSIRKGEVLALVGESGCGKSAAARAVLKLNDASGAHQGAAELRLNGRDIMAASEKEMLEIRGKLASMIFQDPMTYLNPTMKVGKQVTEILLRRDKKTAAECRQEAVRLLEMVQIPDAAVRAEQYPHQYSGGMRQRAMIAMALAGNPMLLIADEPTTALDPTIQRQILALLRTLQMQLEMSILLITHDLSVVANTADKVAVMYAGRVVELCDTSRLFANPAHPYTKGLLASMPSRKQSGELHVIKGSPPDLYAPLKGCAFSARCEHCMHICLEEAPPEQYAEEGHRVSCWLWDPDCPKGEDL